MKKPYVEPIPPLFDAFVVVLGLRNFCIILGGVVAELADLILPGPTILNE